MHRQSIDYRPEIDGLRAIAVVSVLIYHADLELWGYSALPGGFLGVDIFFVISGYLISLILLNDLQAGSLSFAKFYERRARRILPALLIVLVASLPLAWLSLAPKAMVEYAGSALATLAFGSNFWFWLEDSYVAEASQLKPLLHTWSLAVEEQFYLFAPVLLIAVWKFGQRHLLRILVLLLCVSLVWAQIVSHSSPDEAFFLLPTRAWQLLAGAILAAIELRFGRGNARFAGLIVLVGAVGFILPLFLYSDRMPHPSFLTAIPVGATAVFLWLARPSHWPARVMSTAPMRYIGAISYSLYLWHMPIFAFGRNLGWVNDNASKIGLILLSGLLAALTHRLIENPMRWKVAARPFWLVIASLTAITIAGASYALVTKGEAGRPAAARANTWLPELDPSDLEIETASKVLLNLGDSHSSVLRGAMREAAQEHDFVLRSINSSGILPVDGLYYIANHKYDERFGPDGVQRLTDMVREEIARRKANGQKVFVVFSSRLPLYLSNELPSHPRNGRVEASTPHAFTTDGRTLADIGTVKRQMQYTVDEWLEFGAQVVLIYPVPEMVYNIPTEAFRAQILMSQDEVEAFAGNANTRIPLDAVIERQEVAYRMLDAIEGADIVRIYPRDLLCGPDYCEGIVDGELLYMDDDHVSAYGARKIVDQILAATELTRD